MDMHCESITLNVEMEDGHSSDSCSSGLEIVTSETDCSERRYKRKRKRSGLKENKKDEVPSVLHNMEDEIERVLEAKAEKTHLSVVNVKNILKHVISNEHVLAMVRNTMKDSGEIDISNSEEEASVYEPKLTRAKTRELLEKKITVPWPITPSKKPNTECQALIERELSEDSSDEEYKPNEDIQSDDEKLSSVASDVGSPQPVATSTDSATQTSWSEDGVFKVPEARQENIGQRTRSKLSLSDTPLEVIESSFVPPDITTDMYDSECDDDDWKNFLTEFTQPLETTLNDTYDDEADPEYNVLEDEEEEAVDKEELRVDKAVKVSKKELNMLMAELFEFCGYLSSDDESGSKKSKETRNLNLEQLRGEDEVDQAAKLALCDVHGDLIFSPNEKERANADIERAINLMETQRQTTDGLQLAQEQKTIFEKQMIQHVQLLTQNFLQTYGHPDLNSRAKEFKSHLMSLKFLSKDNCASAFRPCNLEAAIKVVQDWEKQMSDSNPKSKDIKRFMLEESVKGKLQKEKRTKYVKKFPQELLDIISNSEVFIYPVLLPHNPFRTDGLKRLYFFPPEDQLIAMGLEQFMPLVKDSQELQSGRTPILRAVALIQSLMMPCKTMNHILWHIRSMKQREVEPNPIKYYLVNGTAPPTTHYMIECNLKPPCQQPKDLLPQIWREHIESKSSTDLDTPQSNQNEPAHTQIEKPARTQREKSSSKKRYKLIIPADNAESASSNSLLIGNGDVNSAEGDTPTSEVDSAREVQDASSNAASDILEFLKPSSRSRTLFRKAMRRCKRKKGRSNFAAYDDTQESSVPMTWESTESDTNCEVGHKNIKSTRGVKLQDMIQPIIALPPMTLETFLSQADKLKTLRPYIQLPFHKNPVPGTLMVMPASEEPEAIIPWDIPQPVSETTSSVQSEVSSTNSQELSDNLSSQKEVARSLPILVSGGETPQPTPVKRSDFSVSFQVEDQTKTTNENLPKPVMKISQNDTGIELVWDIEDKNMCDDVKMFELYSLVEDDTSEPQVWNKVGDVELQGLPMGCTVSQYAIGCRYHFAVCCIDSSSRGPFSEPVSIVPKNC